MSQIKPTAHSALLTLLITMQGLLLHASAGAQAPAPEPTPKAADETQQIPQAQEDSSTAPEAAKTTPNLPVATRLAEEQRQLLSQLPGPPSPLWLPVNGEQLLAFWQEDRSGKPLGAVLMLHDQGENPRRAETLRRLHEYLPLYGWGTFSMELPKLPDPTVPPRPVTTPPNPAEEDAAGGNNDAEENKDPATAPQLQEAEIGARAAANPAVAESRMSREEVLAHIQRRIEAATAYLHQQAQFNLVLLGEGQSALWTLQYLDKAVPPAPVESADKKRKAVLDRAIRVVVLMNVPTATADGLEPLTNWLRHPEVPTFDVFTDLDLDTLAAAQQRRQAAKQKGYEHYVQRRLPPPNEANPEAGETLLTKAIRGFLQKHAKGVELK